MNNQRKNGKTTMKQMLLVIVLMGAVGALICFLETRCVQEGCYREKAVGSSYCVLHKPYTPTKAQSTEKTQSSTTTSTEGTADKSYSSSTSRSTTSSTSTTSSQPKSATSGTSKNTKSTTSSSTKSSKSSSSYHDTYDDGYDDVYDNEDYDMDRYYTDSDYASGVDDAMDELGEDW